MSEYLHVHELNHIVLWQMPVYPLENTKDLKKAQLDIAEGPFVLAAEPDAEKVAVLLKNSSSSTLKTVLVTMSDASVVLSSSLTDNDKESDCSLDSHQKKLT
eukprot:g51216.t1